MYIKAVKYKDTYLAPGSEAMRLYQEKDFKKLDKLLKECAETKVRMEGKDASVSP